MFLTTEKFRYPDTPPEWLSAWISATELGELFAAGIRMYASKPQIIQSLRELSWDKRGFRLRCGKQVAEWILDDKGAWTRRCSCGYKNDRCVHTYIAATALNLVLREEGWDIDQAVASPGPQSRTSGKGSDSPLKSGTYGHRSAQEKGSDGKRSRLDQPAGKQTTSTQSANNDIRLEVEVDFKHHQGLVTLRFYKFMNDRRELLKMQQLHNLGMAVLNPSRNNANFSEEDVAFLRWVRTKLKERPALLIQNLNVLKLPEKSFQKWQERWEEQPGRFIERQSQKPMATGSEKASLFFNVCDAGDEERVRVEAVVETSGSHQYLYHEVLQKLTSGAREVVVNGHLLDFELPVSKELMIDVFAQKSPRMKYQHVVEHLPNLLSGRIDILKGELIEERIHDNVSACVRAWSGDGGDVLVRVEIGGAAFFADSIYASASLRRLNKRTFEIDRYKSAHDKSLRDFLVAIKGKFDKDEHALRINGKAEDLMRLVKAWRALPEEIDQKVAVQLQALLQAKSNLQAVLDLQERGRYVDVAVNWEVADTNISNTELKDAVENKSNIIRTRDGNWAWLDFDAAEAKRQQLLSDLGLKYDGTARFFGDDVKRKLQESGSQEQFVVSKRSRQTFETFVSQPPPEPLPLPEHLSETLRDYQIKGFDFLADRCAYGIGAILADDMGLGKTVQTLALLDAHYRNKAVEEAQEKPGLSLIVCPASVVGVWVREAAKFCPELRCAALTGSPQKRQETLCNSKNKVFVCTYAVVRNDLVAMTDVSFDYVVLDEAQQIKNPEAKTTQSIKTLDVQYPLALTGTPLENHVLDLWSIVDFLNPGYLESKGDFLNNYSVTPSERRRLAERVAPIMLRRTKREVAKELPERTEEVIECSMTDSQRKVYELYRNHAREVLKSKGPMGAFAALTLLREICCHPQLVDKKTDYELMASDKIKVLMEMVTELIEEGHSVLVFSQFTKMLALVEKAMEQAQVPTFKITGATPQEKRHELISDFDNAKEPHAFLLSLRAAGTGLTLTKADYVFICDPWWNPAVEAQAIDRTHRIGQKKPVVAYRLVTADTVEKRVMQMKEEKAQIIQDVMDGGATSVQERLTENDLRMLLD